MNRLMHRINNKVNNIFLIHINILYEIIIHMRLLIVFSTYLYSHIMLSADYMDVFEADRTTGKLLIEDESEILNEENFIQKVILDNDNVYRLKVFSKEIKTTPKVLKRMINFESQLFLANKIRYSRISYQNNTQM